MVSTSNNFTYEFHNELNPHIWIGKELNPTIREKLLQIAEEFLDFIELDVDVEDVTLTGSLANYTYTKYSDFDIHIITDFSSYGEDKDVIEDYFNAKKTVWNTTRDITIKGYEVEMYLQDTSVTHYSTGVYSLKNDEWITEPKPIKDKTGIDKLQVATKKKAMLDIINFALSPECDVECAEKAKDKFKELRKIGLEKGGELSPENLAFKELRRSGDVERLLQGVLAKKDKALSLDSVQKESNNLKNFMGITNKRGPRHQSLTAGVNKLVNGDLTKSIGIVAQMHKRKAGETIPVHNLKKQVSGGTPLTPQRASQIIAQYGLDVNKIRNGQPRQLSTSGIKIGYNPQTNSYYLTK